MAESKLSAADHERTDISARTLWLGVPAIVLGIAALALLVLKIYPGGTIDSTLELPLPHYPDPQLQTDPVRDMQSLRAAQLARLNGTSWVDEPHDIVHIPIEAAMREIAQHGIEDWPSDAETNAETLVPR